jgi:hypothetical protein
LKQFRDGEQDSIIDLRATEEDKKLGINKLLFKNDSFLKINFILSKEME